MCQSFHHVAVVLLCRLSLMFTVRTSLVLCLAGHRSYVITDQHDQHAVTSPSCPSLCTCSVDLVVRCQGQKVITVPQFPPNEHHRLFAELNMAGANVRKLLPDDFVGLRVRRIVLNGNRLGDALNETVFVGVGNHLRSLMLGACAIRTLPPRLLAYLIQLEVLHLWSNHIEVIPEGFFVANSELNELLLWGNNIETINNRTFYGLRRLRLLDLDRNRLSAVERGALSHVRHTLEVLRLSENHISSLSSSILSNLRQLRVLTLASNRLRFIDARMFVGLDQLQTLSLANNRIQFLADGSFQHLVRLRTLNLSGNRLDRVWAGTFTGLSALTSVDLSRNRLSRLPEAVFGQSPALRQLVVEDNWLSTLARCTLSSHARMRFISVIGNMLECGCRLVWISQPDMSASTMLGNCVPDNPDDQSRQHDPVIPVHKTASYIDYRFCPLDASHSCLL